ncbi:MAG: glycosyltransferase [Candidatus Nanopelagicales bacterium]|nr:glycosyltransferase [Candidatus Nanopelagicales bacterium]
MAREISVVTSVCAADLHLVPELLGSIANAGSAFGDVVLLHSEDSGAAVELALATLMEPTLSIRTLAVGGSLPGADGLKSVLELATGPFILALPVCDVVANDATDLLVDHWAYWGTSGVLYADTDQVDLDGSRTHGAWRQAWDLDLELQSGLIGDSPILQRDFALDVLAGAPNSLSWPGLALAMVLQGASVRHLPRELTHHRPVRAWRWGHHRPDEGARMAEAQVLCGDAGWQVEIERHPTLEGLSRVRYPCPVRTSVSVVVPTRGGVHDEHSDTPLILRLIESIDRTTMREVGLALEYIVVCDEGFPAYVRDAVYELTERRVRMVDHRAGADGFNFSAAVNAGVMEATGDFLIIINDDVELIAPGWVPELVGLAGRADVGAVGVKLLFADASIQHLGMTVQPAQGGLPYHHNYRGRRDTTGYGGRLACTRAVWAVTGAFMAIERRKFLEVGGMCTALPLNYNDVDLCLKLRALGYATLITPFVEAVHLESASRNPGVQPWETVRFKARWGSEAGHDPFPSPRISWIDLDDRAPEGPVPASPAGY